jgi:hypothetical protein
VPRSRGPSWRSYRLPFFGSPQSLSLLRPRQSYHPPFGNGDGLRLEFAPVSLSPQRGRRDL